MSTQEVNEEGNLGFMSSIDSNKNHDIEKDDRVQLYYANKSSSEYLSVYGHAEISTDKDKLEKLWTPIAKAWFNERKKDPSISLIKITPEEVYYWDTKHNKLISLIKIAVSDITAKENDGGIEGKIALVTRIIHPNNTDYDD